MLANPQAYTDEKRLHAKLAHLRKNAPVSWVEVEGYRPFWAITKHADIMDIERQNNLFTNDPAHCWQSPRPTRCAGDREAGIGLRTLIPYGRPAPSGHAQDWGGLVSPKGHAR